ncbi:MAG: nucleoside hydrolase [Chloroflexi bacterium AL-W]|nr:nucleoside hydrolase [Chloroflexi bacterium AL-N1]NOK66810.1 nucleoside hydrolase [Chloroflexi bacterium AL-N10]NOK74898.1 nucleoside hydrolase [Chloroflexi bacterium AL-N5]NOK81413.1 nucleoside hydrolase [Chloroflexi bacterium AL-W]NOK88882.1 nucleoside hydrolase [Chloroflexi bacterium AL-N15]
MSQTTPSPVPVILDTDIGSDIDDTWALAMLLRSPELDVKLIVSSTGDTTYRAKIVCKLLEVAGRTDIPVAIGIPEEEDEDTAKNQAVWVADYDLNQYPGKLYTNGIVALTDALQSATEPTTLMCIGPLTNIPPVLEQAPYVASNTRFVGMHGSIAKNYNGQMGAIPEYNVRHDVKACQAVFAASWREMIITPLDTCGMVMLRDAKYQAIVESSDPLLKAVIENYHIWNGGPAKQSSILFDTVAIHLAYSRAFLRVGELGVRITDDGYTILEDEGRPTQIAIDWNDLDGFENALVQRLTQV